MSSNTRFPSHFGKYILLDRVASGGMAEVYRAKISGVAEFQRLLAIKCMLPNLVEDEDFIKMFIDEAKLASKLSHSNIVQIYELGRLTERLYIAMELVNGRDLRHIMKTAAKKNLKIPTQLIAYILAKAGEGLDYAHRFVDVDGKHLNLVHRDVSPQNILVSYDGEVKVVDFGIAKAESEARASETQAGVVKGKFSYMAPEQLSDRKIDHRVDVFALGALIYELYTGKRLYTGESELSILMKARDAEVPDMRVELEGAPEGLGEIANMCLAKDPDDRYAYASEFAEKLTPLLISENRIYGAKQAKAFMYELYSSEIEFLREQMARYMQINQLDCVASIGGEGPEASTEVFNSTVRLNADAHQAEARDNFESLGEAFSTKVDRSSEYNPTALDFQTLNTNKREDFTETQVSTTKQTGGRTSRIPFVLMLLAIPLAVLGGYYAKQFWRAQTNVSPPAQTVVKKVEVTATKPKAEEPKEDVVPVTPKVKARKRPPTKKKAGPSREVKVAVQESVKVEKAKKVKAPESPAPPPPPKVYGFISIKANGARNAKIFINGKEVGYSPLLFHKYIVGKHKIKIVGVDRSGKSREKSVSAEIKKFHTRGSALKLVVNL
ncbi:MAG: serine/threonine-protein kinase [Myxococcota bacterium]|jgi:serine/threonine protein kinase|nr:serine/threonine-protein kinase [Myxococcota bacterium]